MTDLGRSLLAALLSATTRWMCACARVPRLPNKRDNCAIFARRHIKQCVLTAWQVVIPAKLMAFSILRLYPSGGRSTPSCFQLMKRKTLKKLNGGETSKTAHCTLRQGHAYAQNWYTPMWTVDAGTRAIFRPEIPCQFPKKTENTQA